MAGRLTVETMTRLPVRTFGPGGEGTPDTWIMFGTHGNETQSVNVGEEVTLGGLEVVRRGLHVEHGRVLIGFGHPEAIKANLRSLDPRVNLNRMWKDRGQFTPAETGSYEDRRAREIDRRVLSTDPANVTEDRVLADMHGTSNPSDIPFAIAEPGKAELLASKFNVEIVTSGFDAVEPGGLDHGANQAGMAGICLEAGYNEDEASANRTREAINALIIDRHTDEAAIVRAGRRVTVIDLFHGRPDQRFVYAGVLQDFQPVSVNAPFGHFEGEPDQPLRVRDASLGEVDRRAREDGVTHVVPMFAGAAGGIKPAGMEMGLFGVEGAPFDAAPAPVQQ